MNVAIFVQARMGSTRLPGKVLKPILGKPLLYYLLERLTQVTQADRIVVLTSTQKIDNSIEELCRQCNILCFRGSEDDVLDRYYQAGQKWHPDAIVRITGDCPLIDPAVVDEIISVYRTEYPQWDYVSNVAKRTFPRGLDVEVFSRAALETAYRQAETPAEREHVTLFIHRHPELFHQRNVELPINLSQYRLTVDTPEDFELIRRLIEHLYPKNPQFSLQDIMSLIKQHPEWVKINAHIEQKSS